MKNIFKTNLFFSLICCGVLYSATATACPTSDIPNYPSIIGNALMSHNVSLTGTFTLIQEEMANETRSGNANCSNKPSNTKTELTTKTWDHIKNNIENLFKSKIISPQKSVADATNALKTTFFVDANDDESATDKINNRMAYANEIASEALALSKQLRPLYQEDMSAFNKASGTGCNMTQSNAILNRNVKAQLKMMAAQLFIQIIQMETDAFQHFLKEPPTLISIKETKEGDGK